MSIRVMTAVFDYSQSTGSDRLVLLVIADRAHDDGTGCWRSKDSIARMARVSRTTVTESIKRLEALGELIVDRRPGTTSLYRVNLEGVRNPADPVDNPVDTVENNPQGGRNPADPTEEGAGIRPGVGHTGGRDTSISVSTNRSLTSQQRGHKTDTPQSPALTSLGRGLDAPPLWEIDETTGEARWVGEGSAPTPSHNAYAGDYRGPKK